MGAQKHGSKAGGGGGGGGGYVGGFLHLFDWNAKSRKKLFSSKSESPEQPKQSKRTDGNMPMTRFNMMEEDDMIIDNLIIKSSSDYSCATSVTDDDGYNTKPAGVVARLMGLDSLPTVNFSDTYSNPSFDSQSLRDLTANYVTKDPEFESMDCQMETISRPMKVKPQKMVIGSAIQKFQTEVLPPKSAKPIPVTRNKLLSPIKSSGFVSSSNPARIMEAASRIPLVGSSSSLRSSSSSSLPPSSSSSFTVPFKTKVIKEKTESLTRKPKIPESNRRPLESNVKNLKSQSQQTSEPKKSISLALQAKANVQKREGLNHRVQSVKTQSNAEKISQKNPVSSNVLKQNNQKQNSLVDRGKSTPKSSCSNVGPQARKPNSQKSNHKKEPYSINRKKRSIEDNVQNNTHIVQDKTYKSNRSNRSDVVSFTFTAPIARPMISNNGFPSNNLIKNTPDSSHLNNNDSNSSSLSCNVTEADALSTLLEQKLRELNCSPASVSHDSLLATETDIGDDSGYGFSSYDPDHDQDRIKIDDSSYAFSSNDPLDLMKKHHMRNLDPDSSYGFSAYDPLELMKKHHKLNLGQDLINKHDSTYGFSSNDPQEPMFHDYAYRKYLFGRQPSPDSVLEPSFNTESFNSSDAANSCKQDSTSVQARELTVSNFTTKPTPMVVDTDLLDSASSITTVTKWEPDYVKDVLANIEIMFEDFTIDKTRKIVNPRVFDRLEVGRPDGEVAKLRRELVFNCVSECMETRCRVWVKGLATVRKPDRLAREVYREIAGWEDMKDSMVDELVDDDMSGSSYKKWLDFDVEAFEIGVEIESRLLDCLINEVVDDILVL